MVNGKKVNIPSYLIKVGDEITIGEKSKKVKAITDALEAVVRSGVPQWLQLEKEQFKGVVKNYPAREDLTMPMQEQLIVELYSK
jgi:small subunit ribosomal protein S4